MFLEEYKVPRILFEARKGAGSVTYKQSQTECLFRHKQKKKNKKKQPKLHSAPLKMRI